MKNKLFSVLLATGILLVLFGVRIDLVQAEATPTLAAPPTVTPTAVVTASAPTATPTYAAAPTVTLTVAPTATPPSNISGCRPEGSGCESSSVYGSEWFLCKTSAQSWCCQSPELAAENGLNCTNVTQSKYPGCWQEEGNGCGEIGFGQSWYTCRTAKDGNWCCQDANTAAKNNLNCNSSLTTTSAPTPTTDLNPVEPPTNKTFNKLNPLRIGGSEDMTKTKASAYADTLSTPGGIVSRIIKFLFPLAGLILFVMLVWGGLEIMLGAVSKKVDAGKQRVTAAIVGFLLLFSSYWIWQIIQVVFGVKIL